MALYRKCPACGANLDPGEKCDCEKAENPLRYEALQRQAANQGGKLDREWDVENQEYLYILTEKSGRLILANSKTYLYRYLNKQLAL